MRAGRILVGLAIAVSTPIAFACTILPTPKPAARTFTLQLKGGARNSGIRISFAGPVKRAVLTDSNGRAQFRELPSGMYTVTAPGIFGWDFIDVKEGGPSNVNIEWPQLELLVTKSIKGRLTDGIGPIQPHELVLKSATTGKVLGKTRNAADGTFAFPEQQDGPYVVFVKARDRDDSLDGPILVSVDRLSSVQNLEIQVGSSSCGLSYSGGCEPVQPIPAIARLSGRVTDFSGAVIPGARVILASTSDARAIATLITDQNGAFDLNNIADGTYSLRISSRAFAVFAADVTINRATLAGHLDVGLALLGSCKNSVEFRSAAKNISAENSKEQSTQR